MGFIFGGNRASVDLTGGVTIEKKTATVVAGTGTAGTTTVATVPANKVWRVLTAWIDGSINGADTVARCTLNLNGTPAVGVMVAAETSVANNVANAVCWDYSACPVLTAGQLVQLVIAASANGSGGITYVEEAA